MASMNIAARHGIQHHEEWWDMAHRPKQPWQKRKNDGAIGSNGSRRGGMGIDSASANIKSTVAKNAAAKAAASKRRRQKPSRLWRESAIALSHAAEHRRKWRASGSARRRLWRKSIGDGGGETERNSGSGEKNSAKHQTANGGAPRRSEDKRERLWRRHSAALAAYGKRWRRRIRRGRRGFSAASIAVLLPPRPAKRRWRQRWTAVVVLGAAARALQTAKILRDWPPIA